MAAGSLEGEPKPAPVKRGRRTCRCFNGRSLPGAVSIFRPSRPFGHHIPLYVFPPTRPRFSNLHSSHQQDSEANDESLLDRSSLRHCDMAYRKNTASVAVPIEAGAAVTGTC